MTNFKNFFPAVALVVALAPFAANAATHQAAAQKANYFSATTISTQVAVNSKGRPAEYAVNSKGRPAEYAVNSKGRPAEYAVNSKGRPAEYAANSQGRPGEFNPATTSANG
jgi:hypothetical protein